MQCILVLIFVCKIYLEIVFRNKNGVGIHTRIIFIGLWNDTREIMLLGVGLSSEKRVYMYILVACLEAIYQPRSLPLYGPEI